MTDLFGNYRSQETRALQDIKSSKYPDTNKDFEKNIQRLNEFVDYIASYLQTMQKGVDKANEDPITKLKQTVLDIGTLLAGGEVLYGVNLGDLQYFLPAIGAMFGFDASQPFPINLFQAVEHFFLGYILPLDSWAPAVNDVIKGWMDALGLDSAFKSAVQDLFLGFGRFTQDLMDILNNIITLGGVFNVFDTTQSGPSNELQIEWNMLMSQFNIANLGLIADPFLETLTPWIRAWSNMVNVIDDFLEIFTVGWGGDGMARINHWLTDLLAWLGDPVGLGTGALSTGGGVGSIPIFGPILNWLVGFDTGSPVLNQLIESLGGTGSTLADLGDTFASVQVDWNAMMAAFSSGNASGGQANFNEMLANFMKLFGAPDLLTGFDPVQVATNAFEQIFVPAGAVTSWTTLPNHHLAILSPGVLTNLLPDPTFDRAGSLSLDGIYTWDGTVDHTGRAGSGSARTFANGTIRDLEGVSVQVSAEHAIDVSTYVKWSGVIASTGNAISLCVNAYDINDNLISDPTNRICATVTTPGTNSVGYLGDIAHGASAADGSGWVKLTGEYVCPTGTAYAAICLEVNSIVSVGTAWFDDCYMMMSIVDVGLITSSTAAYNTFVEEEQQFWNWLTGSTTHPATVSGTTAQSSAIPNISAGTGNGQSADLLTNFNNMVAQLLGIPVTAPQTPAAAAAALGQVNNTLVALSSQMQQQQVQHIAATQYGQAFDVPFYQYPDASNFTGLPFDLTYSGTGSGHLEILNGQAHWHGVSDGDRSVVGIYNGTDRTDGIAETNTDFQELQATIGGLPNGSGSKNYALLHADATGANYTYGLVYLSGLSLNWELGCYVAGVKHVLFSGTNAPLTLNFRFRAGVGGDPYRFQGVSGSQIVFDETDASHVSQVGSGFRRWGFRSDTASSGAVTPAPASYVGCADTALPTTQGSGFRASCSSTTPQSISVATNTSPPGATPAWGYFPNGFFDTVDNITPDMVPSTYSSHDAMTINTEGWYLFELRSQMNAVSGSGVVSIYTGYLRNGVFESLANGPSVAVNVLSTQWAPTAMGGNCPIYCKPGDQIVPIIYVDNLSGTSFLSGLSVFGEANNRLTYWSMTRMFGNS